MGLCIKLGGGGSSMSHVDLKGEKTFMLCYL